MFKVWYWWFEESLVVVLVKLVFCYWGLLVGCVEGFVYFVLGLGVVVVVGGDVVFVDWVGVVEGDFYSILLVLLF